MKSVTRWLPPFHAIAACERGGGIGLKQTIPWNIPEDLQHFRQKTLGHVIVVGRKTIDSMPFQAFQNRISIGLTQKHLFCPKTPLQAGNLEELASLYHTNPSLLSRVQFVIGGGEIFRLFFRHRLIQEATITHLHQSYSADTFFPLHELTDWSQKVIRQTNEFTIIHYTTDHNGRNTL